MMQDKQITFEIAADDLELIQRIAKKVKLSPAKVVEVLVTIVFACDIKKGRRTYDVDRKRTQRNGKARL